MCEAKQTEFFSEWLAGVGHTLPANFADIDGFGDLFTEFWADSEIGFETEDLFSLKLEAYANIWIPVYKQKLDDLAVAIATARNPSKSQSSSVNHTATMGPQSGSTTDLPFDGDSDVPAGKTSTDGYTNSDTTASTNSDGGMSADEIQRRIDALNGKAIALKLNLLNEFKPLFMEIYQ